MIDNFPRLSPEKKLECIRRAKELALDLTFPEPRLEDYEHIRHDRWGPKAFLFMVCVMVLMFIVGFVPSAMRVYKVASETFYSGIENRTQSIVAGAAFVIMAEIATIAFVISARLIEKADLRKSLYTMAVLAALAAIIGNLQVALEYNENAVLDWLKVFFVSILYRPFTAMEAVLPPTFTLFGGLLLGELVLGHIETRRARLLAYQRDVDRWHKAMLEIENTPEFFRQLQLVTWEIYTETYKRHRFFQEVEWTNELRKKLVAREISDRTLMTHEEMDRIIKEEIRPVIHEAISDPLSGSPLPSSLLDKNPGFQGTPPNWNGPSNT